jgi:type 1 glutamine amidotransferase
MRGRVHGLLLIIAIIATAAACGSTSPTQPSPAQPIRVLMLTATAGYRHDSIATARSTMGDIVSRQGYIVNATETLADINAASLASTSVLMFALTSGELAFDQSQKDAIVRFVEGGGGFIGIHSASDTLYSWPDYGRILGAYFKEHPWTRQGTVTVEDSMHAVTAGLGPSFSLVEEFYTFQTNPRGASHVLLSLDATSVGAQGDYPLSWTQTIGRGRSYYNALGHFDSTWTDPRFQNQLGAAVRWAAGR